MQRLVRDVGRCLILNPGTGSRAEYEEYLKRELLKERVTPTLRDAILDLKPGERLLEHYLRERTNASFQGSGDLRVRVRQTLGISKSAVPEARLEALNPFFEIRNIVHAMDFVSIDSTSTARVHRTPDEVAGLCTLAFGVATELLRAAAEVLKKADS